MIYDLETDKGFSKGKAHDVCIAGGGIAGITLAIALAEQRVRVLLLEAGGLEYSADSQGVYEGESVGRAYFDLKDTRLRFLGGSSNHWIGRCRTLDAEDFEQRDFMAHSGWPISRDEVEPYLERASQILEISSQYDDPDVSGSKGRLQIADFKRSPPVRLGDKYLETLKSNEFIDLVVNANLVDVRLSDDGDHVGEFICVNYSNPDMRHAFSAKHYVLAMGGIETPRMMLNFTHNAPNGLGNNNDLVGRFFMEHFHTQGGYFITDDDNWTNEIEKTILSVSGAYAKERQIGNAGIRMGGAPKNKESGFKDSVKDVLCESEIIEEFVKQFFDFQCPRDALRGGSIKVVSEQAPNRNSRVLLSDEVDQFGLRRSALDWQATAFDRKTIRQTMMIIGEHFVSNNLGNVKMVDWLLEEDSAIPGVGEGEWQGAGFHHMGTTRMSHTAADGVVDKNCKVFGLDNLYIAGSSVFTTSGHANPTLMLTQLALRLADHLGQRATESSRA